MDKTTTNSPLIEKLVSGGQTGVDLAALDVARELGIPCGGWCPKGRWSEAGAIAPVYPLVETPSEDVAQRTEWNARDSDATLVIVEGATVGGTTLTVDMAVRYGKPCLVLDLLRPQDDARDAVRSWLSEHRVRVLNVAGPRESTTPGINAKTKALLRRVLGNGS
jgi:hypothetical protein